MADEIHVFFKGKLPSRADFNRAIRALGHPASLVDKKGSLEGQSGFMPMRLFRANTPSDCMGDSTAPGQKSPRPSGAHRGSGVAPKFPA